MPYYIKANPRVAEYLGLTKARSKTPDGNYLLWQADLNPFGGQFRLDAICAEIGAVKLTPLEQKRELDGTYQTLLPVATDERFVMPDEADGLMEADGDATIEHTNEDAQPEADEDTETKSDEEGTEDEPINTEES